MTTELFWDCECRGDDYIKPHYQMECDKCKSHRDDCADSRINEVEKAGFAKFTRMCGEAVSVESTEACPDVSWHYAIEVESWNLAR